MKCVMFAMPIVVIFFCLSCGQGDSGNIGPENGPVLQLKPSDLEPSLKLKEESANDILQKFLLEESTFYANKYSLVPSEHSEHKESNPSQNQDSSSNSAKDSVCSDTILSGIKLSAKGDSLQVSGDVDLCPCYAEIFDIFKGSELKANINIESCKATARMYAAFRCDGGNFSKLDGKTLKDLVNDKSLLKEMELNSCAKKGTQEALSSFYVHNILRIKFTSRSDSSIQESETKNISAMMTADNKMCRKTVDPAFEINEGECIRVERRLTIVEKTNGISSKNEGIEDYSKLQLQNLKSDQTSTWYDSGLIKFIKNKWAGEVVYRGGDENPTYEYTDGDVKKAGRLSKNEKNDDLKENAMSTPKSKDLMDQVYSNVLKSMY